jgi:tetratricopeptide (TPR) repeat protein
VSGLLLLAALAFGQTATKTPPADEPVAVPAMSAEQMGAALAGPASALASGNLAAAGDQLDALLRDPTQAPVHGAAWAMLAGLYEKQGLLVPAVEAWARAIELDPAGNGGKVLHAAELADEVGDAGSLAPVLGNNLGVAVDGAARNRLAEIAGTYHLRNGNFGPALGALMMGDPKAEGFADVELLRGVVLAQQERYADAVAPLTTAQALARSEGREARFDDAVTLNVARAHYGNEDWGQAILWYARVPRSSEFWLDAQFERAWAHFRAQDVNGSLGLLMNHGSPFFTDWYWPEADLLRAYSLFMICKFPDASAEMNAFVDKYTDVRDELKRLSGQLTAEQAFEQVGAFREGRPTTIPAYLLRPFRDEQRMEDAEQLVARIDDELAAVGSLSGAAGTRARAALEARKQARIAEEGQRVLDRVQGAVAELDDMLNGIEITKLDLLALETQMYERAAATGVLETGSTREARRALRRDKKNSRVWPWQGEYWVDELGYYQVTTAPDCPESLQTGETP